MNRKVQYLNQNVNVHKAVGSGHRRCIYIVWIQLASLTTYFCREYSPAFLHLCKSVGMKKSRAGQGQKRKRAFLGSPQVEIAGAVAVHQGGRRGLARPAIEPNTSLPMPQAINRHKGCLSDEFVSSCLSMSIPHERWVQEKKRNICNPGGSHPPQAGWLGAICSHQLLLSQPPPNLGSAQPAGHQ